MSPLTIPPSPELVTVTVDGKEFKLPKGKNLLQALLDSGIYVPHYCYHPSLSVAGNCRLCLVEVVGRPKPEVSCNMVVTDGLSINVNSPVAEDCRKGMMEFLLVNHPLDCPICDRGGECMLQRYSVEYGWGTARTVDDRRRFEKPQFDPLIDIERNRCIMCTRCVRFCEEVAGEHVMGVFGHGSRNYIGTFGNRPVGNVFSGNVIDLCPVGCLTSKPYRFKARPWELRQTPTTTRTTIGPVTAWSRGGRLYRVTPPVRRRYSGFTLDEDTTRFISNEARFGTYYVNNSERLLTPLIRQGNVMNQASWQDTLKIAAGALKACGEGEALFLAGERSTNEEFFLISRLARTLVGGHIDWRMRFVSEAAAQAAGAALAAGNGDFDLLEKKAYQSTVMIEADILGAAPDIALRFHEAARRGWTKLGLIGTRVEKWLAEHASSACVEQPEDLADVLDKLTGALAKGRAAAHAPHGYEKLFGLLCADQGLLALGLDNAGGLLNPALVPATLRLLKTLGESWHFLPLTAARNAKGAIGCGGQSDRLPGGKLGDAQAAAKLQAIWKTAVRAPQDGLAGQAAPALLQQAAQGKFKVLFLNRCDELVLHPQRELIEQALKATPTVIMTDVFPSWLHNYATVIFPGAEFFETNATMTDIDGSLQRMTQGSRPAGETQEEWRVLESLCNMLGAKTQYRDAEQVFKSLQSALGLTKTFRMDDLLPQWPGTETPQVHHLYFNYKTRPVFKLNIGERPELPAADKTPVQAGGDVRLLWIHHAQGPDHLTLRSTEFHALRPQPKLELNPADGGRLGLRDGDWVIIEGGALVPNQVMFNPLLAPGVAFGSANVLGLSLKADTAGIPAVKLKKTDAPAPQAAQVSEEALVS